MRASVCVYVQKEAASRDLANDIVHVLHVLVFERFRESIVQHNALWGGFPQLLHRRLWGHFERLRERDGKRRVEARREVWRRASRLAHLV